MAAPGAAIQKFDFDGVVVFGVFLVILPMLPELFAGPIDWTGPGQPDAEDAMYAVGMAGAGAGWFLILHIWGLFKSLRLLARRETLRQSYPKAV